LSLLSSRGMMMMVMMPTPEMPPLTPMDLAASSLGRMDPSPVRISSHFSRILSPESLADFQRLANAVAAIVARASF
ncbi:hypothetical protein JD844_015389, partial [Phrynosoma platyrhinos]